MPQYVPVDADRKLPFLSHCGGKAGYMAMNGAVDWYLVLYALSLLVEKCFTGTIKSENWSYLF